MFRLTLRRNNKMIIFAYVKRQAINTKKNRTMKKFLFTLSLLATMATAAFAQNAPKVIKLNQPTYDEGMTLMQALKNRKSSTGFTEKEISLQDISNLMWAAVGVNRPDGKRTAPTGSNRQEIELYAFFKDGAYYYNYKDHTLELVAEGDYRSITGRADASQAYLNLLFIADTDKTGPGNRPGDANTVSYVDVGYISQNVYLYCASAGIGSRARGGWDQKKVVETLGLKDAMIVVLGQTVGYCE